MNNETKSRKGLIVYVLQETGKEAFLKDLPNHLSKFEAFMANNNTGFLVGGKVH